VDLEAVDTPPAATAASPAVGAVSTAVAHQAIGDRHGS
jgi:hypothetical protein